MQALKDSRSCLRSITTFVPVRNLFLQNYKMGIFSAIAYRDLVKYCFTSLKILPSVSSEALFCYFKNIQVIQSDESDTSSNTSKEKSINNSYKSKPSSDNLYCTL